MSKCFMQNSMALESSVSWEKGKSYKCEVLLYIGEVVFNWACKHVLIEPIAQFGGPKCYVHYNCFRWVWQPVPVLVLVGGTNCQGLDQACSNEMYTLSRNFDTLIVASCIGKGFQWPTAAKSNISRDIKTTILFQLQNLGKRLKPKTILISSIIHEVEDILSMHKMGSNRVIAQGQFWLVGGWIACCGEASRS